MSKPPPSPGNLNSSRKRALEIGTSPQNFPEAKPWDAQAGIPADHPQASPPKDNVTQPGTHPSPTVPDPSPFKLGNQ